MDPNESEHPPTILRIKTLFETACPLGLEQLQSRGLLDDLAVQYVP